MANWAIVIGINQYWEPARHLKGAVGDAMRMARWLLASDECRVLPENMFLLARPKPEVIPDKVEYRDALADELLAVIPELDQQSGGQGDRFFFYFSGHGITNNENFRDEQALIMADFTPILTNKALKFSHIKDYFKATSFQDQFFFIDACRNILPWGDFETGSTTKKKQIDKSKPAVDQHILYSTAPRSKSWEGLLSPDDLVEQGAFTGALLDGLGGAGMAKVYSVNDDEYLVQKDSLFNYVVKTVEDRKIPIIKDPVNPVYQRPRKDGESVTNPVLARIPVSAVKHEKLELLIEPDVVWPEAQLEISAEDRIFQKIFVPPITGVPLQLDPLQPMTYTVRASAPNHVLDGKNKKARSFPLYAPTQVSVRLVPLEVEVSTSGEPPSAGGGGTAVSNSTTFNTTTELSSSAFDPGMKGVDDAEPQFEFHSASFDSESFSGQEGAVALEVPEIQPLHIVESRLTDVSVPDASTDLAHLIVESSDPLATLEVTSSTCSLLKTGEGHLELGHLQAGFYRARLVTPEGQSVEEIIDLSSGETEAVQLDGPPRQKTRLMDQLLKAIGVLEGVDQTLEFPKPIGPVAAVKLSTVLTLVANAVNRGESWLKRKELPGNIGLIPFKEAVPSEATSGLQIIFGIESASPEKVSAYISKARVRLWPFGQPVPESPGSPLTPGGILGLAEFQTAAQTGPHWLAIEIPDQMPVIFSLVIFPGRLTMLVFHSSMEGRTRIFQYLPGLEPDESSDPTLIRRLELIQRFSLKGRFDQAYQIAESLLHADVTNPLASILGGYLAAKLRKSDGLDRAHSKLLDSYPGLSDGYVLKGEYQAFKGKHDDAAEAFHSALDHGIPIFANGIVRLYEGAQRYDLKHPRVSLIDEVFGGRVRGLLWSAWTVAPEGLSSGRLTRE